MVERLFNLRLATVAVLLVLLDLLGLGVSVIIAIVSYLGMATTIANVRSSDNTVEKALVLTVFAAPWLPYVVVLGTLTLTIFLCYRFVVATGPRGTPAPPIAPPAVAQGATAPEIVMPSGTATSFDRFATYYSGERIKLADFVVAGGAALIVGKTFENCTLFGPAILNRKNAPLLEGCSQAEPLIYIEVQPDTPLVGAIRVEDCVFRRCHFVGVGLAALKNEMLAYVPPPPGPERPNLKAEIKIIREYDVGEGPGRLRTAAELFGPAVHVYVRLHVKNLGTATYISESWQISGKSHSGRALSWAILPTDVTHLYGSAPGVARPLMPAEAKQARIENGAAVEVAFACVVTQVERFYEIDLGTVEVCIEDAFETPSVAKYPAARPG